MADWKSAPRRRGRCRGKGINIGGSKRAWRRCYPRKIIPAKVSTPEKVPLAYFYGSGFGLEPLDRGFILAHKSGERQLCRSNNEKTWVYVDRVAGGHCHSRDSCGVAVACFQRVQGSGAQCRLYFQPPGMERSLAA